MPDKIIYPSIDLFLYDLKDGLGQYEAKIEQNSLQFYKKIYGNLDTNNQKYAQIQKHQTTDADAIDLLETQYQKFSPPLDGWYYPLQISDTYALQVNYSGKLNASNQANDDEQELNNKPFQALKQELENHIFGETGTIGQSWLIWGKLTEKKSDSEIEEIAKTCYTQIVSNYDWNRDFIGKGQWLGGTIFELWYRPENLGLTSQEFWEKFRKESHHLLIWLFPENQSPDEIRRQVVTAYHDLLRLFQYRHKVIWAYYQSRLQKTELKKEYVEVQPSIQQAKHLSEQLRTNSLKLNQLQKTLANNLINLSDYTIALNNLENHSRTIQVNLENYKSRLDEMTKKYAGSNLDFFKEFRKSDVYAAKYQRQVEADYANLSPGLTLLQNLNSTIQGIIDLEQTKSDRNLNTNIALAGIGLATSQIASAVILTQPPTHRNSLAFRTEAFVWSLGIGAIAMLITWAIIRLRR